MPFLARSIRIDTLVKFAMPFSMIMLATSLIATPLSAQFEAGAAKRIITPFPLLPISGGMGVPKQPSGQRGELMARAVVFRNGETTVAFVSLDLLGFPSVLADRVRAKVVGIPKENILISSTHTHSAPDCYAFPDGKGGHTGDLDFMAHVCEKAGEAVNEAVEHLRPAKLRIATGEAQGKIAYNYYAPDLYDRRMSIIQAMSLNDQPILTLVNYAIHPEVLGNEVGILSPDLVGPLCDKLEKSGGGMGIFINGAQGGMVTADNRILEEPKDPLRGYWKDARTWDECIRIGELMATEAIRIISEASWQPDPRLDCRSKRVRFPVESATMWQVIVHSPLNYPHAEDRSIQTTMHRIDIGDARILTIPGEALPNIGFYLKRHMQTEHPMLFGLTNDAFGYIMTKVDFHSFSRYEYISRTSLGEQTGEILIDEAIKLLEGSE